MNKSSANSRSLSNHRGDIVFVFALAAGIYLAWLVRDVLVLLYVSGLFAVVLRPVVRWVGRLSIGGWRPFRGYAILILLVVAAAAITGFGFLAVPPVARDLTALGGEMPARLPGLIDKLSHLPFIAQLKTGDMAARIQGFASTAAENLLLSIRNWASAMVDIATGCILTIYFMIDGKRAYRWFLTFIPHGSRERLDNTLGRAEIRMGRWLLGQGSLMLILGVTSTVVYLSLGVRYPYALGVMTGFLNIVPVLGAAICVALAMLVAALDSWGRVLGVAIFYVIYLWIENSFLTPRIMKNSVDLPALAILVALLLGSALEGIVGAMVAIPTAVLVAELINEYMVQKDDAPEAAPTH